MTMYGEFLPNVKIDRIMMENSGDSSMRVNVDASISYRYDNNSAGNFFKNEDFKKYIKIRIIQSTSQEHTDKIFKWSKAKTIWLTKTASDMNANLRTSFKDEDIKDLTVNNIIDTESLHTSQNSYGDTIGKVFFKIPKFEIPESNPNYIAYFIFAYLDLWDVRFSGGDPRLNMPSNMGSMSSELAIKDGKVFGKSYQFYTEGPRIFERKVAGYDDNNQPPASMRSTAFHTTDDDELWEGPIHQMNNGQWMTGLNHSADSRSLQRRPNGKIWSGAVHQMVGGQWMTGIRHTDNSQPLIRKTISNNKVHDFRQVEKIRRLTDVDLNLSSFENDILAKSKIRNFNVASSLSKKPTYFSDIFLARDRVNRAKFCFALDYHKLMINSSVFGKLYEEGAVPPSSIKSLSIKRRRVKKWKNYNKLGSPLDSGKRFSDSDAVETLVATSDNGDNSSLITMTTTSAGISEISITSEENAGVRFFKVYDKSIRDIGGVYQYGVEVVVEDHAMVEVRMSMSHLLSQRKALQEYYNLSVLTENYDPNSNRFTQEWISSDKVSKKPWLEPIYSYFKILNLTTNFDPTSEIAKNVINMAKPDTGTPKSIMAVIGLFDNLLSKLERLVGGEGKGMDAEDKTSLSTSKLPTKTTRIEHWFTNDDFDANLPDNIGYEYLQKPSTGVHTPPSHIPTYTKDFWENRITSEKNKYNNSFAWDPESNSNWSFLSPSQCVFTSSAGVVYGFDKTELTDGVAQELAPKIMLYNATMDETESDYTETNQWYKSDISNPRAGFDSPLSDFYETLNLTVKPSGDVYDGGVFNPTQFYQSLSKTFAKTGLSNDSLNSSQFEEYGRPIPSIGSLLNLVQTDFYAKAIAIPCGKTIEEVQQILDITDANAKRKGILDIIPHQVKDLIDDDSNINIDQNSSTSDRANFMYSMINRIDVLSSLGGDMNSRIKKLKWVPLIKAHWEAASRGENLLCRMKPFECPEWGLEHPKALKLPVYDTYFMLETRLKKTTPSIEKAQGNSNLLTLESFKIFVEESS